VLFAAARSRASCWNPKATGAGGVAWLTIGIGVNLAAAPDAGAGGAGRRDPVSLKAETGIDIAPEAFLDHLAAAFDRIERQFATYGFAPIRAAWLQGAARLGETITARLPARRSPASSATSTLGGNLVLETPGTRRIAAAEIFF
jgi:BirA family biotin operon repressor/biotin-[acetyl-CoA-carboxylase] ligase